ncbi:unnamed protein product [Macrosiphum euphorbiae]|uniref:Uncharacterized protein n=1 Tax=Macrosiphum euphorbiae TaxID=13131 RepID=A0AAV0WKH9_9HEMI|nr:unnamed protein product [Macrosiphum euphorbiae]
MCFAYWLRKEKRNNYITYCDVDHEDIEARNIIHGAWRTETTVLENLCRQGSNHPLISEVQKRGTIKDYFNNEGAVPWQENMIH